jgi:hypothetical protein
MPTKPLTLPELKEYLDRLSAAIELDQIYVDSLPRQLFSKQYDDGLWRDWRHATRAFITKLHMTADAMPPMMLQQLAVIATADNPALVEQAMLEILAEIVSGCSAAGVETAEGFFGWLIKDVERRRNAARTTRLEWLVKTDPLRIAQDPECGYPPPRMR